MQTCVDKCRQRHGILCQEAKLESMMLDIYGHILPCVRFKNWNLAITCTNMQLDSDMKRNFTSISSQSYHNHDWFCLHHSCSSPALLVCLVGWCLICASLLAMHPALCNQLARPAWNKQVVSHKGKCDWYRLVSIGDVPLVQDQHAIATKERCHGVMPRL